jgi:uncharacterized membrane protein YjgN (DUF898 family)
MNDMGHTRPFGAPDSAFHFTGNWREFLPIALTNFALTVVTLGIYRFWAKARERRYLWSRTHFIDDTLEWTGTGMEMFIGALVVLAVLIPFALLAQLGVQALFLRGDFVAGGLLLFALYASFFFLIGFGGFRALRYRLSRTRWHGIRGGSTDPGFRYGWQWMWKKFVAGATMGLLVPWSMTSLWNDRWNAMSFGHHRFTAYANTNGLFGRWLLIYLVPVIGLVLSAVMLGGIFAVGGSESEEATVAAMLALVPLLIFVYVAFLLLSLSYYAAFYRKVVETTMLGDLSFRFTARTRDWLMLILGTIGLVIVTLGFGLLFVGYRNWSFAVRHMEASGEVDLDMLLQSSAPAPRDAEGLADAFDIGAI